MYDSVRELLSQRGEARPTVSVKRGVHVRVRIVIASVLTAAAILGACSEASTPSISRPGGFVDGVCVPTIVERELVPPEPYPATRESHDLVWFGTSALWTALDLDGTHSVPRKSAWWSERFLGGELEQIPDITVEWQRLDTQGHVVTSTRANNGWTASEGWFMLAGFEPESPGCWKVTATYKGATLSFIYARE